jgi:GntR family transcriptional regulator / MocR family aminotransferase
MEIILRLYDPGVRPANRQLYTLIRNLIVDGGLSAGAPIPPSRTIADALGLSRTTVTSAVASLSLEGYLTARQGAGTFVSALFAARRPPSSVRSEDRPSIPVAQQLSRRLNETISAAQSPFDFEQNRWRPFTVGTPMVSDFPFGSWRRALAEAARLLDRADLAYSEPMGYPALREQISQYLTASRGLDAGPERILIVSGTQSALDLSFRALTDPGDVVVLEDPCYLGASTAARFAGLEAHFVAVDAHGLIVDRIPALMTPRLAVVAPTHQFPLGSTMSLQRRLALLRWAETNATWIIEDDYDSEYRFDAAIHEPIAVLDHSGLVIYAGTFSKTVFPALRLGYMVLPDPLVAPMRAARLTASLHSPMLEQIALAIFMQNGSFALHQTTALVAYRQRRSALFDALARTGLLAEHLSIEPSTAGLHICVQFQDSHRDDEAIAHCATQRGLDVWPLSIHCHGPRRSGLLLGYGDTPSDEIATATKTLAEVIISNTN